MPKALPEETRDQLIEAAENIVWRVGFGKMTIDEVADAVQISKGAVYRFFASKEEIGDAIVARHTDGIFQRQQEIANDPAMPWGAKLQEMLLIPVVVASRKYNKHSYGPMAATIFGPRQKAFARVNEREAQLLAKVVKAGQRAGEFRAGTPMPIVHALRLATSSCIPPYLWLEQPQTAVEDARRIIALMFEGLLATNV